MKLMPTNYFRIILSTRDTKPSLKITCIISIVFEKISCTRLFIIFFLCYFVRKNISFLLLYEWENFSLVFLRKKKFCAKLVLARLFVFGYFKTSYENLFLFRFGVFAGIMGAKERRWTQFDNFWPSHVQQWFKIFTWICCTKWLATFDTICERTRRRTLRMSNIIASTVGVASLSHGCG